MPSPRPHRPHGARAPGAAAFAAFTALTLVSASLPRIADAAPAAAPAAKEPPLPAEASEYYQQALRSRSQGHHAIAAELFVAAYRVIDTPEGRKTWPLARGTAIASIYDALVTAYNQDGDLRHLCDLHAHLGSYVDTLDPAQTQAKAGRDKLASIALTITAKSGAGVDATCSALAAPEPSPVTDPPPRDAAAAPPVAPPKSDTPVASPPSDDEPRDDPRERQRRVMTTSGGVLVGIGAISLGVMTGALVRGNQIIAGLDAKTAQLKAEMRPATEEERAEAREADRQGERANAIAWATGVSGAVLLGVGVALLAAAGKRRSRDLSVAPAITPTTVGATVHLRF